MKVEDDGHEILGCAVECGYEGKSACASIAMSVSIVDVDLSRIVESPVAVELHSSAEAVVVLVAGEDVEGEHAAEMSPKTVDKASAVS